MYYVTMIDNFMSGWGDALGKQNAYCIKCKTLEDAEFIAKKAKRRSELGLVRITKAIPRQYTSCQDAYYISEKTFDELGGTWKE